MNIHWKVRCWSSNNLTTWYKELTHWKRPWWWQRLRAGGEGGNRGGDGWMAPLTSMDMSVCKLWEIVKDREVLHAAVHGVAQSWTWLSDFTFTSNEHPWLISFRMDWLDLFAVQGTLKSLLQHHSSKASIFQCSAFFTVQLSYSYMTTGKTIALTRQTFVGKVISLLFDMLSTLVITFLPRIKRLLISWLQSLSAVILEPPKIKSVTVSPSICHEVWDQMPWS